MANYIKINEQDDLKCTNKLFKYLTPEYVYIPYIANMKLNVKTNDDTSKYDVILYDDNNNLYSSVSGKVLGASNMLVDGIKRQVVIIENDYEERTKGIKGAKRKINQYTKIDIINLLQKYSINKYNLDGQTLIVNGMDYEPYEKARSFLLRENYDICLEMIDSLIDILDIHKCFLAINCHDTENVNNLYNNIGTYSNINLKLMPDGYPIANQILLTENLVASNKRDSGIVFLNIEDIYEIYNILKNNRPQTRTYVTFTGNLLSESRVIETKLGTSIKEIVLSEFKIKNQTYDILINGLLSGYQIKDLDAIITHNTRSVFITDKINAIEEECINCGMCYSICPAHLNPRNKQKADACLACGLCSYVCPAKKNFKVKSDE